MLRLRLLGRGHCAPASRLGAEEQEVGGGTGPLPLVRAPQAGSRDRCLCAGDMFFLPETGLPDGRGANCSSLLPEAVTSQGQAILVLHAI